MFKKALILFIFAVIVIFSVQNASPVTLTFFLWRFEASLAIVIFLCLIVGLLLGSLLRTFLKMKTSGNTWGNYENRIK